MATDRGLIDLALGIFVLFVDIRGFPDEDIVTIIEDRLNQRDDFKTVHLLSYNLVKPSFGLVFNHQRPLLVNLFEELIGGEGMEASFKHVAAVYDPQRLRNKLSLIYNRHVIVV